MFAVESVPKVKRAAVEEVKEEETGSIGVEVEGQGERGEDEEEREGGGMKEEEKDILPVSVKYLLTI